MSEPNARERSQKVSAFQFRLIELFVCVTVAAVVFAFIGRFAVAGTLDRLGVAISAAGVLAGVMEIHYRIKMDLGQ